MPQTDMQAASRNPFPWPQPIEDDEDDVDDPISPIDWAGLESVPASQWLTYHVNAAGIGTDFIPAQPGTYQPLYVSDDAETVNLTWGSAPTYLSMHHGTGTSTYIRGDGTWIPEPRMSGHEIGQRLGEGIAAGMRDGLSAVHAGFAGMRDSMDDLQGRIERTRRLMERLSMERLSGTLTDDQGSGNIKWSGRADADMTPETDNMPRRNTWNPCECGCGQLAKTGRFLRGHATRRRWQLIKAVELSNDVRTPWQDPTRAYASVGSARNELAERGWSIPASRRTFGIEFELISPLRHVELASILRTAGIPVHDVGSYTRNNSANEWTIKTDSSIRRGTLQPHGYEIVSPPLRGKTGERQVAKVLKLLRAAGCKVNASCGTHVHIGISDLSVNAVKRVVTSYYQHQDAIDQLLAPSRRYGQAASSFCNRWNAYEISQITYATTINDLARGNRYRTVNLQSYPRLGTIEFRQHQGTLNATKIMSWVKLVRGMIQASVKADLPQVAPTLTDLFAYAKLDAVAERDMQRRLAA